MASSALEEKINKIRLQNEEIRRRYEEVEADKKNAAKLNALVQMVPSDDWPERKEPPEFSAPPKSTQKQKPIMKEHNDKHPPHYSGIQERLGKKDHKFAQGDGPPPDPKYNFLADSEREMRMTDDGKLDDDKNKSRNKTPRGAPRRRGGGGASRDAYFKDNRGPHAFHSKEDSLPEYEAWRAERNRIDEARINRQKTAEGNWRREWDSNKTNVDKDSSRKGDANRKESTNYERRNNHYENDYSNRGHGGSRTYHGSQKNYGHQDYRREQRSHHEQSHDYKRQAENKPPLSPNDDRTVTAIDKSIKVTVNHGSQVKGPVMSVKVNSPSIAGTGRVGPRQKSRVTYCSQSDTDVTTHELNSSRQKSYDEKTAGTNSGQKSAPKSPFSQRKKEGNSKSPYSQRKEFKNDESSARPKNATKTSNSQRNDSREQRQANNYIPKPQRAQKRTQKPVTDVTENIFSSDDAIPSEYNPDKSFNYEDVTEQKVRNENDISENILNETNETDEGFADASKNSDDSAMNIEPIDQSICDDNSIENTNHENNENNELDKIIKNIEGLEVTDSIKDPKTDTNIEHVEIDENNVKNENNNIDDIKNSIEKDKVESEISNNILQDAEEKQNSEKSLLSDLIDQKNDLCVDVQQKVKEDIPNEEVQILISEKIENSEILMDPVDDTKLIDLEQKHHLSENSQEKLKTETLNEEIQIPVSENSEENKITEEQRKDELIETANDESQKEVDLKIDSETVKITDIVKESIESGENKTIELDISENKSINDSGFLDESDKVENKSETSIVEPNAENDIEKNFQEPVKSDSVDTTKEICNKTIEICDIHSAAHSETSHAIEDLTEKSENKQEVSKTLENLTKDSDINVVKDINESSQSLKISDVQIQNETAEKENAVKEESTKAATVESKED